jgi:hypothetical protein
VFLSAEVQDLIRSRLAGAAAAASPAEPSDGVEDSISSDGPRRPEKYNIDEASAAPAAAAAAADEVSWTVCCCDGATFSVVLPDHARVAEAKRAIGVLRDVSRFAMELFVEGEEEPLDDKRRLSAAEKVPLFMLPIEKEASDRLALEALFWSCGGAGWRRKDGWMTEAELGEWEGVTVDEEGRVVKLQLYRKDLTGALPSEIQLLSAVTVLNLHGNYLAGPIPAELGQLEALEELYLFNNQLSEAIPAELARLPALYALHLHDNQLSGQEAFRSQMEEHNPGCKLLLVPEDYSDEEDDSDEEESEGGSE